MNIQFDFVVTDWTVEDAKKFYDLIIDQLGQDHKVTGGVSPATEDDPLYEEGDHETETQ